jgi:hypothetical protein
MTRPSATRGAVAAIVLLPALAWLLIFTVIPASRQDFPLNDDGLYNIGLHGWLAGEGIRYYGWSSIPQLGQWLWAAPFAMAIETRHVATRLSTIALSLIALVSFFVLLRRHHQLSSGAAAFACLTLAFNPLYFMLSGTFMTDVPSIAFSFAALACFSIGLERSRGLLVLSLAPALAVALTRQTAVVVPLVMAYEIWRQPRRESRTLAMAVAAIAFVASVSTVLWFGGRDDVLRFTPQLPTMHHAVLVIGSAACYLGVFVLPAALLSMAGRRLTGWWTSFAAAAGLAVAWAGYTRAIEHQPFTSAMFPSIGNMLTRYGTIGEGYVAGDRPLVFGTPSRIALTLLGCVGTAWLIHQLRPWFRNRQLPDVLTAYGLLQIPFLFISFTYFDRYLLALLPSALGIALSGVDLSRARVRRATAGVALVATAVFAVMLTHDWLAWNAARWELGRRAVATRDLRPQDIEGGFEWNNWFAIPEGRWRRAQRPSAGLTLPYHLPLFDGMTGRCALSFSPLEGAPTVDAVAYSSWLGGEQRQFLLACRP